MRKFIFLFFAAVLFVIPAAQATTYTYVGSFTLGQGPDWHTNPLAYSGIGAAALIYGGDPSDYVTSTIDSNPADINFMAYYSIFGGSFQISPDDYFIGTEGTTHYQDARGDVSAYVFDAGATNRTFVFRVSDASPVPEPGSFALLSTGLLGMGATVRRRFFRANS